GGSRLAAVLPAAEVGQDADAERRLGLRGLDRPARVLDRPEGRLVRHGANSLKWRPVSVAGPHPMRTVGSPRTMDPPWAVMSPIRAAGMLPISTVKLPRAITSGGPTHVAMSATRAAGRLPIRTVGQPGGRIGPPTCGTRTVTIGQTCMSVMRAAGCPIVGSSTRYYFHLFLPAATS